MSSVPPTSPSTATALTDGHIAAKLISGLDKLDLSVSVKPHKARVIEVTLDGKTTFAINEVKIVAKIPSKAISLLKIGHHVTINKGSNNNDIIIHLLGLNKNEIKNIKSPPLLNQTSALPRLRVGLTVAAEITTKPLHKAHSQQIFEQSPHQPKQPNSKTTLAIKQAGQIPSIPIRSRNSNLHAPKQSTQVLSYFVNVFQPKDIKKNQQKIILSTNQQRTQLTSKLTSTPEIKSVLSGEQQDLKNRTLALFMRSKLLMPVHSTFSNSRSNTSNKINDPRSFLRPDTAKNLSTIPLTTFKKGQGQVNNLMMQASSGKGPFQTKLTEIDKSIIPVLKKITPNTIGQKFVAANVKKRFITSLNSAEKPQINNSNYNNNKEHIPITERHVDVRINQILSTKSNWNGSENLGSNKLTMSPVNISVGGNKNSIITGIVIGKTPEGKVILETSNRFFTLNGTLDLPLGARVLFKPLLSRTNTDSNLGELTIGQLTNGWVRLEEFLANLTAKAPDLAKGFINKQIGKPTPQLTATLALFISAIQNGDPSLWLGSANKNIVNNIQPNLIRGLDEDFFLMHRASEPSDSGWRAFFFPMINDEQLNQIQLFINQDKNSSSKDKNKTNKTRFILNLKLDELGELQIDGRVNSQTVELLIQTIKPISAELKQGIRAVFQNTLSRTEIDGNIVFRVRKQLDPLPISELNGYSDPLPSITDI